MLFVMYHIENLFGIGFYICLIWIFWIFNQRFSTYILETNSYSNHFFRFVYFIYSIVLRLSSVFRLKIQFWNVSFIKIKYYRKLHNIYRKNSIWYNILLLLTFNIGKFAQIFFNKPKQILLKILTTIVNLPYNVKIL